MNLENINLLAQIIESMEASSRILETAFVRRDVDKFKKSKEEILKLQKQISEVMKEHGN